MLITSTIEMQLDLLGVSQCATSPPPKAQLLKWIGNKHRFAKDIISYFPREFGTYYEPFLGSGAVLAALGAKKAVGSDSFKPLIEIWQTLQSSPEILKRWYKVRWQAFVSGNRKAEYEKIKAHYNLKPNGADLLFISRACYGGVVRFRQADGYISTPIGIHKPISPESFSKRVDEWHERTKDVEFVCADYRESMSRAMEGDLIYCDPPYTHSQSILYGAQKFALIELFNTIELCKSKGVNIALSIDGNKKSGNFICSIPIPEGLFEREIYIHCGRSMLRRFQMQSMTLENELVSDRLLLTY